MSQALLCNDLSDILINNTLKCPVCYILHLFSPVRMDSFFLAEMFKYLFLLFADAEDLTFDVEDYVFTTEAHLLPLSLSTAPHSSSIPSNRTVIDRIPL